MNKTICMKRLIVAVIFLSFFSVCVFAQDKGVKAKASKTVRKSKEEVWERVVPQEPGFPGNDKDWQNFVKKNLIYPENAKEKRIEDTVVVEFIILKDSTISDLKVISGQKELHEAAIGLIEKVPYWRPYVLDGCRRVKYYMKVPVVFKLEE